MNTLQKFTLSFLESLDKKVLENLTMNAKYFIDYDFYKDKMKKKKKKPKMSNAEKQAAMKQKISKQPLEPNRLPFDQGTSR